MSAPQPHVPAADVATEGPQITEIACVQCGRDLAGLDGRYTCTACGWTNPWWEGHSSLPTAEDDPDYPGPGKTQARRSA